VLDARPISRYICQCRLTTPQACIYAVKLATVHPSELAFEAPYRFQILDHQWTTQKLFVLEDLYQILEVSSLRVRIVCGLIGISEILVSARSIYVSAQTSQETEPEEIRRDVWERSGSIPFDHDKIFRTIFAIDLAVEMILETTGLVLVDGLGEVRQELGDL